MLFLQFDCVRVSTTNCFKFKCATLQTSIVALSERQRHIDQRVNNHCFVCLDQFYVQMISYMDDSSESLLVLHSHTHTLFLFCCFRFALRKISFSASLLRIFLARCNAIDTHGKFVYIRKLSKDRECCRKIVIVSFAC